MPILPPPRVRAGIALAAVLLGGASAGAQQAPPPRLHVPPALWWVGGTLAVAASLSDARAERASLAHRSPTLDDLADVGDALGSGRYAVPALGGVYLVGRLARQPRLADVSLHAAAAYVAGNVVVSLGKPAIGRHRPDTTGSPWRFHPVAAQDAWHSFPSGHTVHAFTLAGAIAEEAHRPWVTAASYGAATLVAWSRVYDDEHWASDVALSAAMGAAIGHASVRFLHARQSRRSHVHVLPAATGATITLDW